jgi:hypothetical protein
VADGAGGVLVRPRWRTVGVGFRPRRTSTVLGVADPTTDVAVAMMTSSDLEVPAAVAIRAAAARLLSADVAP